jgi:hydroxymethylpyrimidine kinase/phosphomethylpyrimidine kinase
MCDEVNSSMPVALAIGGLDPSGGAGILADTLTFAAFDCHPTAVVTSITFQNSTGITGCAHQSAEAIRAQALPILTELTVASVKTGMLPLRETILAVVDMVKEHDLRCLVVDPVMRSTSGHDLMDAAAIIELRRNLIPLARLVAPNIPEAEELIGNVIGNEDQMIRATRSIREMGARAVLIKGGHLEEEGMELIDVLDDAGEVRVFKSERIPLKQFRGSGCRLASGIAAGLAHGRTMEDSVQHARDYVVQSMRKQLAAKERR